VNAGNGLVAIGASAGGPAALVKLLAGLPAEFPAAIVLVQHLDAQFTGGMATWLQQHSQLTVRIADEGDRPVRGTVLLAGTNDHLALTSPSRVGYTPNPIDDPYRPSIDVFFKSVVRFWTGDAVGVLLTGMGRDGALGLKALRDGGRYTIAQDQTSSAVYGMPKAAAALNAAIEILPIERIADRLIELFQDGAGSRRKNGDSDERAQIDVR
jgi:two-component system, chemotaxis family, response regulator WspF